MSSLLMSHFPILGSKFFKAMNNVESSFPIFTTTLCSVVLEYQWGVWKEQWLSDYLGLGWNPCLVRGDLSDYAEGT